MLQASADSHAAFRRRMEWQQGGPGGDGAPGSKFDSRHRLRQEVMAHRTAVPSARVRQDMWLFPAMRRRRVFRDTHFDPVSSKLRLFYRRHSIQAQLVESCCEWRRSPVFDNSLTNLRCTWRDAAVSPGV